PCGPPDARAAHMSPAHRASRVARRAYLSAGPAGRAADRAVALVKEISDARPDCLGPPAAPLSRLVDGDREGFAAALTDALAAHRDHYGVASRRDDPDGLIDFGVLALACPARERKSVGSGMIGVRMGATVMDGDATKE